MLQWPVAPACATCDQIARDAYPQRLAFAADAEPSGFCQTPPCAAFKAQSDITEKTHIIQRVEIFDVRQRYVRHVFRFVLSVRGTAERQSDARKTCRKI